MLACQWYKCPQRLILFQLRQMKREASARGLSETNPKRQRGTRFPCPAMTADAQPFNVLLSRARQRDPEAISALCRQYEPRLRVVARVLLGPALRPHLDSMDLVQSVHRSLLVGIRDEAFDISTPENLMALAVTMLRRKVSRHWRRAQRQQRLRSGGSSLDLLPTLLADLTTREVDPAEEAQYRDQVEQLCRQLDATERHVLALRLDGYTTAEIAQQLGLNHITLRVRLTRLRERLRSSGVLHDWL
jgi:RNA polymerase sigma factor (sigma-70 family)